MPNNRDVAVLRTVTSDQDEGVHSYPWYGVRTRSNHENVAALVLTGKGYDSYLPMYRVLRRRSDRTVESEYPLFPGYVFCRFDAGKRLPILTTTGVVSIVGFGKEPAAIPEDEIEAVRIVLRSGQYAEPCPYLREGQRVRIAHGSMEGLEGTLLKKKSQLRMVISITLLQRSISVEIDHDRLLPV
jgi:transcription antitermination factor NusG